MDGIEAFRGRSYSDIERHATEARRFLGLGLYDAVAPHALLTKVGRSVLTFGERRIPIEYAAETMREEGKTYLSPERERFVLALSERTYEGLDRGEPRATFSLCHELGHLLMHTAELVMLAKNTPSLNRATEYPRYKNTEFQADAFASALMMPATGISALERTGDVDSWLLCEQYGASKQAAEIRIRIFTERRSQLLG